MKIFKKPLFYLLPLLAAVYSTIMISSRMEIMNVKITRNNKTENITLPYATDMAKDEVFFVSFSLLVKENKSVKLNIIPDDCLQEVLINGEQFSLEGIKGLCDYSGGAYLDFSKYVREGLNNFEIRIINSGGGKGGLHINQYYNGLKDVSLIQYIFAFLLLLSAILILAKLKFNLIAISIIVLGITVRLILYTYTAPTQNTYDIWGHLEYVQIVAEEKRLPKTAECWSCNHPPLYYIVSAVAKNVADGYDFTLTNRIQQQGQMILSIICVVLGMALLINLFGNRKITYLTALILTLWPHLVIASPRIGNDVPFYFGALFCMLFAQRYWRLCKNSDMLLASIGASIALAAKSTGFVILGAWAIIYIFNILRLLKVSSLRVLLASIFIIAISIVLSYHRPIADFIYKNDVRLANATNVNSGLKIKNTAGSYFSFDMHDYLFEPYTSTWADRGGRQHFWNFALKTSLFGEFSVWNSPAGHTIATLLNILVLFIFMLALWGIIHVHLRELPPLLFLVSLFASLIFIRAWYSLSCMSDVRYILPVVFPLVYFSGRGIQILENSRLRKLSYASMLAFAVLSFAFIVGQAFA
ncbi:MAG: hypothetical protein LBH25_03375 [Fibromonadaceae bacterium]|jgi:hypothetical protein|nr:hypothetical protein [Fibromonadaceae bacterium]